MSSSHKFSIHPSTLPTLGTHFGPSGAKQPDESEDLTRILYTALVSTRSNVTRDLASELYQLSQTPAFRAILSALRQHARLQGISDRQAAEEVVETFRKMDGIWGEYVIQEGVERLKNPQG